MSFKINLNDPNNLNNKVFNEQETRRRLLLRAKENNCEGDMILLFDKYDRLLRNCTNAKEREDIAKLGNYEMWRLLGGGGELYVDGKLVAKED